MGRSEAFIRQTQFEGMMNLVGAINLNRRYRVKLGRTVKRFKCTIKFQDIALLQRSENRECFFGPIGVGFGDPSASDSSQKLTLKIVPKVTFSSRVSGFRLPSFVLFKTNRGAN